MTVFRKDNTNSVISDEKIVCDEYSVDFFFSNYLFNQEVLEFAMLRSHFFMMVSM